MDGQRRECPIEPDKVIRYIYGEGEDDYLLIAPSHDSIQMFPDSQYNHLRYYDVGSGEMRTVWLPAEHLADLHDAGIPHTKRESISECEYEAYLKFMGRVAQLHIEVEHIDIDAQVTEATRNLDAEIAYYLGEDD